MLSDTQFYFIFIYLYFLFFFFLKQCGNCVTIYISLKVNCRCFPEGLQPHQVATLAKSIKESIKIYGTNPNNVTDHIVWFPNIQTQMILARVAFKLTLLSKLWHNSNKVKRNVCFYSIYVLCLHSACGIAHFVSALQIYSTGEDRR